MATNLRMGLTCLSPKYRQAGSRHPEWVHNIISLGLRQSRKIDACEKVCEELVREDGFNIDYVDRPAVNQRFNEVLREHLTIKLNL